MAVSRDRNYTHNLKIQDDSVHCTSVSVRQQQTGGISMYHYCHPGATIHQPDLLLSHLAPPAGTHSKSATEKDTFTGNIWISPCVSLGCKSSKEIQRTQT